MAKNKKIIRDKKESSEASFYDLKGKKISKEILTQIPQEAAEQYEIVPLEKEGRELKVGMVNPRDIKAQEALKFIALRGGLKTKTYRISSDEFQNVIKQYKTLRGEVSEALGELEKELDREAEPSAKGSLEERAGELSEKAPITKMVAVMLNYATWGKSSDIHIEPLEKELRVRFRVEGVLHTSLTLPVKTHSAIVSRIKILANLKIDETRIPQDGRFQTKISGRHIDFRVSTLPTTHGEKIVMRILDPSVGLKELKDLGLQGRNLRLLKEGIEKPFGLVLITGPTGSGKSTTLYAALNQLDKGKLNIVTLEDPVEYFIEGVNQSQVKPEIDYSFATGLRHVVRQDPDVIMVGEIRDNETASLATHASLTGHLVFSTLHTNDAIGVIPRLVDMQIEPFLITSTLELAGAQRLVRRLCQECKERTDLPEDIKKIIERTVAKFSEEDLKEFGIKPPYYIYESKKGCKACGGKGVEGRVAIFEMLSMTPQLERVILGDLSEGAVREEAERQGMTTMQEDGIIKALQGIVNIREVLRVTE